MGPINDALVQQLERAINDLSQSEEKREWQRRKIDQLAAMVDQHQIPMNAMRNKIAELERTNKSLQRVIMHKLKQTCKNNRHVRTQENTKITSGGLICMDCRKEKTQRLAKRRKTA